MSQRITKETTVQYRAEQAALLAKSYTELAIMNVLHYDRTAKNECLYDLHGRESLADYNITAHISYYGNSLPCTKNHRKFNDDQVHLNVLGYSSTKFTTADYNSIEPGSATALAAVIVDVYVSYADPDHGGNKITYSRRTLQKI